MTTGPGKEPPIDLGDAAEVEDISAADAADRLEADPETQVNRPDRDRAERHPGAEDRR
ncbi:hypothetical protein [Nocardioides ferulae]|uniref:hypothetical protein n=1 Tax=Nocardioides ferulae TaxID=2340821 RepID=UPI0013DDE3ED|nr:hypothetical protein [Nocardioides ferulae]